MINKKQLKNDIDAIKEKLASMEEQLEACGTHKYFEPTHGEIGWYLAENGDAKGTFPWSTYKDKSIIAQGNVFETEELTLKEVELRKAKYILRKAIYEANPKDWVPDFSDDTTKYGVYCSGEDVTTASWMSYKYQPSWMYMYSLDIAVDLLSKYKAEFELVLGE